jgi:Uma2 family endonuclease
VGAARTLLTIEEFRQLQRERGKLELIHGELVESVPPTMFRHTQVIHGTYKSLLPFEGAAGLGNIYVEAEYRLEDELVLRPDVSIAYPNHPVVADDLIGAPLLAIEVISPSNDAERIDEKVSLYLSHGGVEVWLMYPKRRSLWIYREGHADEFRGILQPALVPGLEIDIQVIFG